MSVDGMGERPGQAGSDDTRDESVRTLLGFLRRHLDLDAAWLSSFSATGDLVFDVLDGDADALGLSPGDRLGLSDSYCIRMVDGRLPAVIPDTSVVLTASELPITRQLGLGAYVGVPVVDRDGVVLGSLCAVGQQPKPYLSDVDMRIVKLVADLLGELVTNTRVGVPPATTDHGSAIRRVVFERDFEVVFQPIHDIETGAVVGVEALSRFPCEPYRPDLFIEQAARLGLGLDLETAIVKRVLGLVPQLPADVFVSVNISPAVALTVPWDELLADTDPARIVLEITEHAAVENYAALSEVLESSRARGLRLAVDDVGSGFSSFAHVLELGPDFVKIDRSITHDIHLDDARRSLTQAIAEFAEQMGVTVIAEGVENQDELDAVGAAGIFWAQGYHLGRPRPHTHGFAAATVTTTPADRRPAPLDLLSTRRFERALAQSTVGMAVVGLDGRFLRTNRALSAMLGYSRRELAAMSFQELVSPEDLEADLGFMSECLDGRRRSYRSVKRYQAFGGQTVWGDLSVVLMRDLRGRPRSFIFQVLDVTADRLREADLVRQATTDPLTGIANRSAAWQRLEQLEARNDGYGVLFCDIERFKLVNDRRGHHTGDQLLVAVADGLGAAISGDDVVARWGGDEFLVITGPIDESGLVRLARRMINRVQSTSITAGDGTEESVTFSVGFAAHAPGDGRTIDDVLDRADQAMYEQRRSRISGTA